MKAAWMSHQIVGREWKLLIFLSLKSKEELLARGILSRIWLTRKQRWKFQLLQQSIFLILKSLLKVPVLLPLQSGGILPKKAELGTNEELPPLLCLPPKIFFGVSSPTAPFALRASKPPHTWLAASLHTKQHYCPLSCGRSLDVPTVTPGAGAPRTESTPQPTAAVKAWQNPSNKMNPFVLFCYKYHYIWGCKSRVSPFLFCYLIVPKKHKSQELTCLPVYMLENASSLLTIEREKEQKAKCSQLSLGKELHASQTCLLLQLSISGTTTVSFKKPQVHRYSQFARLFSKTSTGHSPKHFTSFGYYVKTLAKKDA